MLAGAVVDDLSQVLAGLRSEDLSDLPVDELAGEVVELRRLVDGLEVEWCRRLAHLDKADVIGLEGHTSMTAFLKDRCRMSAARAQRAVSLSHRLPICHSCRRRWKLMICRSIRSRCSPMSLTIYLSTWLRLR